MRIPRVHVSHRLQLGEPIALDRDRSHYLIHVLRLKAGDEVVLFNGEEDREYRGRITSSGKALAVTPESAIDNACESSLHSEILQGLGRSDHVDWMIQKTTELGVNRILLFNAERTQSPLKSGKREKKLDHWRRVAASACEQCGRARMPVIDFYPRLDQALSTLSCDTRVLLDPAGDSFSDVLGAQRDRLAMMIGPEGGFTPEEIDRALARDFQKVRLGSRILRTETAATASLAIAQSILGDLG